MNKLYRIRQAIALAVVFVLVAAATACPSNKGDTIRKAAEASYRLPAATVDILEKAKAARDAGTLDAATAQRIGEILEPVAKAELVFVGMVRAAHSQADRLADLERKTNRSPSESAEIQELKTSLRSQTASIKSYFDVEIVAPFLRVLELAKLISGSTSQAVVLAVTAAKLIIQTIGSALKSSKVRELAVVLDPGRPPEPATA
jgi:hypothetical protein